MTADGSAQSAAQTRFRYLKRGPPMGGRHIARRDSAVEEQKLVTLALEAQKAAYAPYSHFSVGAALLCADGTVYTGCNIENAAYSCGICAERTAAAKAVSEGRRSFVMLAVAGSSDALCTPCGLCRQFLLEFAPDLTVLCANREGAYEKRTLRALLPGGFDSDSMA